MTAQIIMFVPRPNPKRKSLEQQAADLLSQIDTSPSEMIPYHGAGIDGIPYQAPPEDCA
jgi:hypothetical protein